MRPWHYITTVAIGIACYANVLPNDYCYDDMPIVQNNALVQAPGKWVEIWSSDYWQKSETQWPTRDLLYRPVTVTSFRLVRTVAGPGPAPQHLVNILLHAACCALVIAVSRKIGLPIVGSLAAGLVFAVLPIHTEAVAAVVGRADLLAACFLLATLLAHTQALESKTVHDKLAWLGVAMSCAFVAVGSKESGAAVFPVLVMWEFLRGGECKTNLASKMLRLSYLLVPVLGYVVLRYYALEGQIASQPTITKTVNVLADAPAWQRSLGVLQIWGMYWAKTLWPQTLCISYSINAVKLATSLADLHVLIGLIMATVTIGTAIWAIRTHRRPVLFIIVAMILCFLPTSNAIVLIQVFFAERTWYLPSIWVCILLAWSIAPLLIRMPWRVVGAVLLLAAAGRVWERSNDWRNNGTLYAAAYEDHPDGVQPLFLYGQWLVRHGRLEEGISLLGRSVTIDPGYTDAQRALGTAFLALGHAEAALIHLQAALMQVPDHPPTVAAMAAAQAALSVHTESKLSELSAQAAAHPDDLDAQLALIQRLQQLGKQEEAIALMRVADVRFAHRARWHAAFAVNLVLLNKVDEAIERYRRSLSIRESPQTAVELAMLLLERDEPGDLESADAVSKIAVTHGPDIPAVLACRAEVLATQGEISLAQQSYLRAIELLPPGSRQRDMFIERAKALGAHFQD